jgi:3',5'-cyclic AMP phosphodiesterase CpdA
MKSDRQLTIIHLSDLHFTGDEQIADDVRRWYDSLVADIIRCANTPSKQNTFVVVSGDLTRSGQPDEFKNAAKFLRSLLDHLDLPSSHLMLVPGNHDISRNKPFERRRDEYLKCAASFDTHRNSAQSFVRRFDAQRIVFFTPDTADFTDAPDGPQVWHRFRQELNRPVHDVKIAVTHRPIDWSDWLSSEVKSDAPCLNLHSQTHADVLDINWLGRKKHKVSVGAGPLSCEKWRRLSGGPPVYHILAISGNNVAIRSRVYLEQNRIWVDRGSLITEPNLLRDRLDDPHRIPGSQTIRRNSLVDGLCELPEYDVCLLAKDLGTAIEPYSPLQESREEFATRLVSYFEREKRLDYLGRAIARRRESSGAWKLRVFVAATREAKNVATAVAEMCKTLGAEPWQAERELSAAANVDVEIARAIQSADIFLVIIARDFKNSRWIAREVGIALQFATARTPRIVPILLPGGELPEVLEGLHAVRIDDETSVTPEVLAQVLRSPA